METWIYMGNMNTLNICRNNKFWERQESVRYKKYVFVVVPSGCGSGSGSGYGLCLSSIIERQMNLDTITF